MTPKIITPPTAEPISLAQARKHLRVDPYGSPAEHPDDELISLQLTAAREWCEGYMGRAYAPQTLEIALDKFPLSGGAIEIPRPPLLSITSVKYVDGDSNEQTLSAALYMTDTHQEPNWLIPADGTEWPATREVANAVKVRYEAGYSAAGDSPQTHPFPKLVRAAILLILGHLYERREQSTDLRLEDIPLGAVSLLNLAGKVRLGMA